MAHIGMLPQSVREEGGYKVKGRGRGGGGAPACRMRARLEAAGAFSVVLEIVAADTARRITDAIGIPTIGIGSGEHCDGQILVTHDLIGLVPLVHAQVRLAGSARAPKKSGAPRAFSSTGRADRLVRDTRLPGRRDPVEPRTGAAAGRRFASRLDRVSPMESVSIRRTFDKHFSRAVCLTQHEFRDCTNFRAVARLVGPEQAAQLAVCRARHFPRAACGALLSSSIGPAFNQRRRSGWRSDRPRRSR